MLKFNQVSVQFSSLKNPILSNITYQVNKGDFVVILGSNGSGKSSLLKLIDRTYQPTNGDIQLDNKPLKNFPNKKLSQKIVTLTQDYHKSLFCSLTVWENCLLAQERHKNNFTKDYFVDYLNQYNPNLSKKFSILTNELSGGEKQALALALSVLQPPEILLLDEHTSSLDPQTAQVLMDITARVIKDKNMTCLMTTHDLDIALQYGNRILVLQHGQILHCYEAENKVKLTHQLLLESCYS